MTNQNYRLSFVPMNFNPQKTSIMKDIKHKEWEEHWEKIHRIRDERKSRLAGNAQDGDVPPGWNEKTEEFNSPNIHK